MASPMINKAVPHISTPYPHTQRRQLKIRPDARALKDKMKQALLKKYETQRHRLQDASRTSMCQLLTHSSTEIIEEFRKLMPEESIDDTLTLLDEVAEELLNISNTMDETIEQSNGSQKQYQKNPLYCDVCSSFVGYHEDVGDQSLCDHCVTAALALANNDLN